MKNEKNVFLIIVLLALIIPVSSKANSLIEIYKKGEILLEEDPSFGKDVDWEELFYDISKEMVIGPDGSIYVTNTRQNNIFHFSKEGKFLKKFGQKGQGPLDFFAPGDPSILDKKYLVVMEYPLNRRISIVNLQNIDSKHTHVLKTEHSVWDTVALKNNRIAYVARKSVSVSKWDKKRVTSIIIKDVRNGAENVAAEHEFSYRCRSNLVKNLLRRKKYFSTVFIGRTIEGNLLVGYSDLPDFAIISPEGKRIRTFKLDYPPIKLSEYKRTEIMGRLSNSIVGNSPLGKRNVTNFKNAMKSSKLLGDHFPYYTNLLVDSAGNILVFPNDVDCNDNCEIRFRVYSPEGSYICTTKINKGKFDFKIDYRFKNILFTENGIYGLFQLKDTEDISLRLVRVKLGTK